MPKRAASVVFDAAINSTHKRRCDRFQVQACISYRRFTEAKESLARAQQNWFALKLDYERLLKDFEYFDKIARYPDQACVKIDEFENMDVFDLRDTSITGRLIPMDDIWNIILDVIRKINTHLQLINICQEELQATGLKNDIFNPEFDAPMVEEDVPNFGWFFFYPFIDLTQRDNSDVELDA